MFLYLVIPPDDQDSCIVCCLPEHIATLTLPDGTKFYRIGMADINLPPGVVCFFPKENIPRVVTYNLVEGEGLGE